MSHLPSIPLTAPVRKPVLCESPKERRIRQSHTTCANKLTTPAQKTLETWCGQKTAHGIIAASQPAHCIEIKRHKAGRGIACVRVDVNNPFTTEQTSYFQIGRASCRERRSDAVSTG